MPTLYVAEYEGIGQSQPQGSIPAAIAPALDVQAVSYTGTAGTSAAFGSSTKLVRITSDGTCSFRFSTDGSAATTSYPRLASGAVEYFYVQPGTYVSAITNT